MDFVNNLDTDTSLSIFSCLDDPSDIVRASAVSRSWREFAINYNLSKNLCLKLFHQLCNVGQMIETSDDRNEESSEAGSSSLMDTRLLEKEHRAYALLARGCTSSPIQSCIADAIIASSTDNFPAESILNTLEESDRIGRTPSYWSSTGQHRTSVPETLLYKLMGDLCVITEIKVQPFQVFFQPGHLIFSSHYVRFRFGHHNNDNSPHYNNSQYKKGEPGKSSVESNYVWTYISQEFPMAQENRLQTFKLPEPVLCIGGYILVEFLGRVQTHEMDGQYYICVSHVKVMGRSLAQSFRVENVDDSGKFGLKVLSYSDPKKMVKYIYRMINYHLSKNLCLKLFHQLCNVGQIIETSNDRNEESSEAGSSSLMDTRLLDIEHRAYALLARGCTSSPIQSCIADAIVASSTDNFPSESILNTLEESDRIGQTPSYWSSTGQHRTSVPETLLYKLMGDLCVITEIKVQPFQAFFQHGHPIYSSHYVRFRFGHHNNDNSQFKKGEPGKSSVESNYVWTYTSQEFPMAQENRLQTFKLPEPVLCIGGYMLVEFLGRVQTQEMDGQYYICVSHVKVMGRSLAQSFQSGECG